MADPYAPPRAALENTSSLEPPHALADRSTRLAAAFLDNLLYVLIVSPFVLMATFNAADNEEAQLGNTVAGFAGILAIVLVVALIAYQWHGVAVRGQSIAKRLLNIRIVRQDGWPMDFTTGVIKRIWVITLLGIVPYVGSLVSIADALAIFGQERRCLHDYIAGTIVIKVPKPVGPQEGEVLP